MPHTHAHDGGAHVTPPAVRRRLALALAPFALATLVGLVALWPRDDVRIDAGPVAPRYGATVTSVSEEACDDLLDGAQRFSCTQVRARLRSGPDAGDVVTFPAAATAGAPAFEPGDRILVSRSEAEGGAPAYFFVDYERTLPLTILAALFAIVVVALSRWNGVAALAGLGVSLFVLVSFVLPAILAGRNPVAVAVVGSAAIMFVALYLAHGFHAGTTTAVLGTMCSLVLTGALALVFVEAAKLTGLSSEDALLLQVSAEQVNLEGLLLGGIVIGTLGVLDDVTVTQASAVWELHHANPSFGARDLYRSAVRIGRDHIASTVNTLVLAYAGAALPLLILFSLSNRPFGDVLTSEVLAVEIVRTLVGSIGLVASVPLTTGLAALVVSRGEGTGGPSRTRRAVGALRRRDYAPPRREREWRSE